MSHNYFKTALLFISVTLFMSCDSTPCDDGFTEVEQDGNVICLPDYVVGIEKTTWLGTAFYHSDYGIIEFDNGIWVTTYGEVLEVEDLD
ncbi:hypothetical protein AAU57_09300 [Nonlabens sp. YIK11]|nr:hypothetical protein AAU57_09300 [Nonlabens sp. YIK11]